MVFHDAIQSYLVHPEFQKFVADTAIDGVNQVLKDQQEKLSSDYKIMKNMKCKGGEPGLMTIKVENENLLLNNLDIDKTKSKLQKEIEKVKDEQMTKEQKEAENTKRLEEALKSIEQAKIEEAPEILSEHLRQANRSLERILGNIDIEEVLGNIFSTFCIGK